MAVGSPGKDLVENVLMGTALEEVVHLVEDDQDALLAFTNERGKSLLGDSVRLTFGGVRAKCLQDFAKIRRGCDRVMQLTKATRGIEGAAEEEGADSERLLSTERTSAVFPVPGKPHT